jgi:hypothetical protein
MMHTTEAGSLGLRGAQKKKADMLMKPISAVDVLAKTIGFKATYDHFYTSLGHDGAIARALEITDLSQPTSDRTALPAAYRKGELMDWAMMFSQQPMKILNMASYEFGARPIKNMQDYNGIGQIALAQVTLLAAHSLLWVMKNRKFPEEPEDFIDLSFTSLSQYVPGVGPMFYSGAQGYMARGNAMTELFSDAGKMVSDASPEQKAKTAAKNIARLSGLPEHGAGNILDAIMEQDIFHLFFGNTWEGGDGK